MALLTDAETMLAFELVALKLPVYPGSDTAIVAVAGLDEKVTPLVQFPNPEPFEKNGAPSVGVPVGLGAGVGIVMVTGMPSAVAVADAIAVAVAVAVAVVVAVAVAVGTLDDIPLELRLGEGDGITVTTLLPVPCAAGDAVGVATPF